MGRESNAPLAITDWADFFGQGQSNTIYFNIRDRKDFILRVGRDFDDHALSADLWNADGSGYQREKLHIERFETKPVTGDVELGGPETACALAYVYWSKEINSPGSSPFRKRTADLAQWDFEGKLNSTTSTSIRLQGGDKPEFTSTPVYAPFVSQGEARVLRAGVPQTLSGKDSHSLADDRPLTFEWTQVSGPTTLHWSSPTDASPTVDGLAFGTYVIRLKATDSKGQSAVSTITYGAVQTDDQDQVTIEDAKVKLILGPMIRLGGNPWPYFDRRNRALADFFGALQGSQFQAAWDNPLHGTITVRKGSTQVTGKGTSFLSDFCSGNPHPTLVTWYPVAGSGSKTGRHPYGVASCESDTALHLSQPYAQSEGGAGWKYSRLEESVVGTWINGSTNSNYYDNVLAFYSLYYRSGLEQYRTYARTLADRWWTMPWIDEGRAASLGDGSTYLFPRLKGVTGLMLRALDGRPDMWPGIRALVDADAALLTHHQMLDMREEAYATAFHAQVAMLDPDASVRARYKAAVRRALEVHWAPNQLPDKGWKNQTFGYATWNGSHGTVTVKHGSRNVVGQGTDWQAAWFKDNAFWTAKSDLSDGDKVAYKVEYLSPNELRLDRPYEGPSASNRSWQASNIVGYGTEPFLLGIVASAFHYAYEATGEPRYRQFTIDIAGWMMREGTRPSTKGLWYARGFPNCEPIRDGNEWCAAESVGESRALAGPVVGAYSWAYLYSHDPAIRTDGDRLYGAMFGKDGGPDADGEYLHAIDAGGWVEQVKRAKDLGFFFGWGFGASWPAARVVK